MMSDNVRQNMEETVSRILELHPKIQTTIDSLRTELKRFPDAEFEDRGPAFWRFQILSDALIKVRLFLENNFHVIETLGVLSLTRYIFELAVILKNLELNENFSYLYIQKMLLQQCEHFDDYAKHLASEIALYKSIEVNEQAACKAILEKYTAPKMGTGKLSPRNSRRVGKKIASEITQASKWVDDQLALRFALYSDDVVRNGYGFQAHLIETKVLSPVVESADAAKVSYEKIKAAWKAKVDLFSPDLKKWRWKEMSKVVKMDEEYEFIYSYTSRLLHALPFSLTTNQKNLEDSEVLIFLRYVEHQIGWIISFAEETLRMRRAH